MTDAPATLMRRYLTLCSESVGQLREKVHAAPIPGPAGHRDVPVVENPSRVQMSNLLAATEWQEARMLVDRAGNLFVWDAALAHHARIVSALGIDERYVGFITKDGIMLRQISHEQLTTVQPEIQHIPAIIHALGPNAPVAIRN
jgi:hypothetical protein